MQFSDAGRRQPVQAARTAAGRFTATVAKGTKLGHSDALRRYRAAQRTLKPREQRFDHLSAAHD